MNIKVNQHEYSEPVVFPDTIAGRCAEFGPSVVPEDDPRSPSFVRAVAAAATATAVVSLSSTRIASAQDSAQLQGEVPITWIGDSLSVGMEKEGLRELLVESGVVAEIDAKGSRQLVYTPCEVAAQGQACQENPDGIRIIEAHEEKIVTDRAVVLALETNGSPDDTFETVLRAARMIDEISRRDGEPAMVIVPEIISTASRVKSGAKNSEIQRAVAVAQAQGIHAVYADYPDGAVATLQSGGMASDGVHFTPSGYRALVEVNVGTLAPMVKAFGVPTEPSEPSDDSDSIAEDPHEPAEPPSESHTEQPDTPRGRKIITDSSGDAIAKATGSRRTVVGGARGISRLSGANEELPVIAHYDEQDKTDGSGRVARHLQESSGGGDDRSFETEHDDEVLPAAKPQTESTEETDRREPIISNDPTKGFSRNEPTEGTEENPPPANSEIFFDENDLPHQWLKPFSRGRQLMVDGYGDRRVRSNGPYRHGNTDWRSRVITDGILYSPGWGILHLGHTNGEGGIAVIEFGNHPVTGIPVLFKSTHHREWLPGITDGMIVSPGTPIAFASDAGDADGPHFSVGMSTKVSVETALNEYLSYEAEADNPGLFFPWGYECQDSPYGQFSADGDEICGPTPGLGGPFPVPVHPDIYTHILGMQSGNQDQNQPDEPEPFVPQATEDTSEMTEEQPRDPIEIAPDTEEQEVPQAGHDEGQETPESDESEVTDPSDDPESDNNEPGESQQEDTEEAEPTEPEGEPSQPEAEPAPDGSDGEPVEPDQQPPQEESSDTSQEQSQEQLPPPDPNDATMGHLPRLMYDYFITQGLTHEGTVGLVGGNFDSESGLNPERTQNNWRGMCAQPPARLDPSTKQGDGTKGFGFGIAQWTTKDRQLGIMATADEMGLPWYDIRVQLEHVMRELRSPWFDHVLRVLQTTHDIGEATKIVLTDYENPAVHNFEERLKAALEFNDMVIAGDFAGIDVGCN